MSSMSELKSRLHAASQTRQITGAMYLLSTSRMKKAMRNIDFNLDYMLKLRLTMKDILSKAKHNDLHNRFIEQQGEGVKLYIVITSDKGLCGSYNSDIVNLAVKELKENPDSILLSIGSKGSENFRSAGIVPDYEWCDMLTNPSLFMANDLAETIIDLYKLHEVNEAYVVYTEYHSVSERTPVIKRLLPLLRRDFLDIEYEYKYNAIPIYEPSATEVFDKLVPHYIKGFMYDVFMQSATSENCARMEAMQSATDNADKMIDDLTKKINAERQLSITNEIIEISSAIDISGAV